MTSSDATATADRTIVTTRLFDAPRELVFEAWIDPAHIAQWWGPDGFTTTIHEMDVRPGGVWRFIMHGPDGVDYPNHVIYTEVAPPERLVYMHGDESDAPGFQTTVMFTEEDGKTRLTMTAIFESAAERAMVVEEFGAIEGAHQTLDRLAEYLSGM
jgi:uncharacterized protein YndB with AHSA1/START domain